MCSYGVFWRVPCGPGSRGPLWSAELCGRLLFGSRLDLTHAWGVLHTHDPSWVEDCGEYTQWAGSWWGCLLSLSWKGEKKKKEIAQKKKQVLAATARGEIGDCTYWEIGLTEIGEAGMHRWRYGVTLRCFLMALLPTLKYLSSCEMF